MRIFFDFEFIENGDQHPIIPVSVGLVREDGEEYYAEFHGVDWSKASEWVLENVKPYLSGKTRTKAAIAEDIRVFAGLEPEFWAYYADYDWVLLCQLYGRMIDLPDHWPMFCLDIKQWMWHMSVDKNDIDISNEQEHDALADARWNHRAFVWMLDYTTARFSS